MAAILAKEGHYLATMEAFLSSLDAAEKRFDFVEEMVQYVAQYPGGGTAIYGLYRYVPL